MKFEYPSQLPVSAARSDIAEAVKSSQVVIVSGQTGSGKTTQLPKILLELGRGSHGRQIVHTQPRLHRIDRRRRDHQFQVTAFRQ